MSMPTSSPGESVGPADLRVLRLVERFEDAWKRGEPVALEILLAEADPEDRSAVFGHALAVELAYRRQRGDSIVREDYRRRFPDRAPAVGEAFDTPTVSFVPGSTTFLSLLRDRGQATPPPERRDEVPERIGKYEVLRRLGRGGQGSAFLARDTDLGHLVVLKRYHTSAGDPNNEAALKDGQALARLKSAYTPHYYGVEHLGDELVLVMEYVPGLNLKEMTAKRPLTPDAAVRLVERAAEGLQAVHACGLVHRDLKPENIVVGDDGVPRLVDFGLATHLGSDALKVVCGTPPYMAPEQARGDGARIDARTDVYGLGGVLYHLLTGQPPHPGTTYEALEHARAGLVAAPRNVNPKIPRQLESVLTRALAPDPSGRYASAGEFRQALRGYRLRPVTRAAVAGVGAFLVACLAVGVWVNRRTEPMPQSAAVTPGSRIPLAGELIVRVWSPRDARKRGWKVDDPGALPLDAGDRVRLEARLNQPEYAYLLWLDGQGQVSSLYPWSDHHFRTRPATEPPRERVDSPEAFDDGHELAGPAGLETVLLLVRRTPLPAGTDLAALAGSLPPTPYYHEQEVAVRGFNEGEPVEAVQASIHRGLADEVAKIDDPLLRLMERLRQKQFDVIKAVRFAYRGPGPGP
ncbi:MAG: protein kinase [Isosphaeraceae bacterium]